MKNLRFGQAELVKCAVDSGTVIAAGDMLFLDTDDVKPASDFTWDTNLATTQASFAAAFMGISHELSEDGDTDEVSVDISAMTVYEFVVASDTYEVGAPLGPDEGSSDLEDQTLEDAVATSAIAVAYERKTAAATRLKVKFASAYNPASANVNMALG